MMAPGYKDFPEHIVITEPLKGKVEIFMDGEAVVETLNAIKVIEKGYPPRYYIPKRDIKNIELIESQTPYFCPFKGEAQFYTIKHGPYRYENAAWAYNKPFDDVKELKGFVAFYPDKVQLIRVKGEKAA